jgi:DNA modification methylase
MMELNKIYCGDNCDLLGQLPRDCVDLVVTSPPYDDLRTYGGHTWDFYGVAWQLKRVLKPGGVIVWVVADATKDGSETGTSMEQALHFKRLGLNLHDTMIYASDKPPQTHNRYEQAWEFMFVLSHGVPKTWNGMTEKSITAGTMRHRGTGEKRSNDKRNGSNKAFGVFSEVKESKLRGNIWRYTKACEDKTDHPAMYPQKLATDHILSWSNTGDLVLDPFTGSGTTCKAAKELGRNFLGFEINPEYCKIAERRIAQEVLDFSS